MNSKSFLAVIAVSSLACGCWTFNQSEFPKLATTAAPAGATNLVVAVNGFEAVVSEYAIVNGYAPVYVPGYYGRHHYNPGFYAFQPTVATYRHSRTTDRFLQRARSMFDDAGFAMATSATMPNYTVEVSFSGPDASSSSAAKSFCCKLFTIFFCDYATTSWSATLRIRDNTTGKVILKHDYTERYETNVAGVIPLFSIASCDESTDEYGECWCLTALTDRAVADATAFLASR